MKITAAPSAEAASIAVWERTLETVNMRGLNETRTTGGFESDRRQGFSVPSEGQAEESAKTEAPEKGQEKWLKGVIYIIPLKMNCQDCRHAKHEAGSCKFCNCGDSEIIKLTGYRRLTLLPPDRGPVKSSLVLYGYDCGHRVPPKRTGNE